MPFPRAPAMEIVHEVGGPVATDNDGGSGSNARVEFRAVYAGDYLVIATRCEAGERGVSGGGAAKDIACLSSD